MNVLLFLLFWQHSLADTEMKFFSHTFAWEMNVCMYVMQYWKSLLPNYAQHTHTLTHIHAQMHSATSDFVVYMYMAIKRWISLKG